ncbi:MAG: LamG-like jellyroll fold domain-containing protein, partial [Solirubrobacterales bacterium]
FGSIDEVAMYNRELTADEVLSIFQNGMAAPEIALDPQPQNATTDVPLDSVLSWTPGGFAASHDVYLGTSLNDVDNATRDNPMSVLVSQGQADTAYEPASLEFGTTYYWRIDEVNAAPDNTIFKGTTWSFTVEPYSYPVTSITATASGSGANMGPQNTINGSGLNAEDQHAIESTTMWLSDKNKPAWIQYEFDKACKLDKMWVWNSNQGIEAMLGFGAKTVVIEYSLDGQTWTTLENVPEFAQATGTPTYTANTTVEFGGVQAKFVKLTIEANWGGAVAQTGLSEVRFFYIPVQAFNPQPAVGATNVSVATELVWRPGREATSHTVYIGTDANAVANGSVEGETVADHSLSPASLDLGTTYYWRVDEVGDAGVYAGDVWNFTTEGSIVLDDFESYDDKENRIYDSWVDGLTDGKSGSQVGYDQAPFAETSTVHGGNQSMPLIYNNTSLGFSEATRTFDSPQDWTQHGITTLVVNFRGQLSNSAASVYVKINDAKIPFSSGAQATTMYLWKTWSIPLASTGANLKSVKSLAIGIEGSGSGTLFVDDIGLYAVAPEVVTPTDPGTTGLVALYTMDGNVQDSSGKKYDGTLQGAGSYDVGYAGQALVLNGINAYVDLPIGTLMTTLTDTTIATHVYFAGGSPSWERIFDLGSGTSNYMFLCPRQGTSGNMRFAIRTATVAEQIVNSPAPLTEGWHHTAVTIDSATMKIGLYVDGDLIASGATTILPKDLGNTTQNWLGRSQYAADGYFLGSLDDFRIYNRTLSPAEIRYLAGDR